MPKHERCPYGAEWDSVDRTTGEPGKKVLQPEDVVELIAQGMNVAEIASHLDAPLLAVEHAVMSIKHMMVWRGMGSPAGSLNNADVRPWGQQPPEEEGELPPYEPQHPSVGAQPQYPAHGGSIDPQQGGR